HCGVHVSRHVSMVTHLIVVVRASSMAGSVLLRISFKALAISGEPLFNPLDAGLQFLALPLGEFGFKLAQLGVVAGGAGILLKRHALANDSEGFVGNAAALLFVKTADVAEVQVNSI